MARYYKYEDTYKYLENFALIRQLCMPYAEGSHAELLGKFKKLSPQARHVRPAEIKFDLELGMQRLWEKDKLLLLMVLVNHWDVSDYNYWTNSHIQSITAPEYIQRTVRRLVYHLNHPEPNQAICSST